MCVQLEASVADFSMEPFPEVYNLEESCSEVSARKRLTVHFIGWRWGYHGDFNFKASFQKSLLLLDRVVMSELGVVPLFGTRAF